MGAQVRLVKETPARDRLLARLVPQPNGCWYWTGVVDKSGYGRIGYKGRRSETIQRAVYDCFVGPIPQGHDVDHACHNADPTCMRKGADCLHRRCGNPDHLRALPRVRNGQLGKERITHCPQGHPYDETNTMRSGGRRYCRTCNNAARQRSRARAKGAAA